MSSARTVEGRSVVPDLQRITDYPALLDEAWRQATAPRAPSAPTVISTFAGCGGSSLGYHMAGYRELLAVEWEQNAADTFRLNFPHVSLYHGDIASLSVDECLKRAGVAPGELDVFDGSPPCQGFSTAGKREVDDPRNQLFREYCRLLSGLRPRAFVMENVSGMVKGGHKAIFAEVLRTLKSCGYKVKARLLNAMFYGVPQSRERLIFVGVRDDIGVEPSHPQGWSQPIPLRAIAQDAVACRSQQINPWIDASRPVCTITKTPYKRMLLLPSGRERSPTLLELSQFGSFPAQFAWTSNLHDAWARIGNSVPPLLMRAVASHVRSLIGR